MKREEAANKMSKIAIIFLITSRGRRTLPQKKGGKLAMKRNYKNHEFNYHAPQIAPQMKQ